MSATITAIHPIFTTAAEKISCDLGDIDLLVRQYRPRLLRFVTAQIRDEDAAFTIVQDTLLKAHRNSTSFRGACTINTWLTGIAINMIRDHTRTQKFKFWRDAGATSTDATSLGNDLRSKVTAPDEALIAHQQPATVHQAVLELSDRQRAIFTMRFLEEMEIPEIASALHIPVATVKTYLCRATKRVRACVKSAA